MEKPNKQLELDLVFKPSDRQVGGDHYKNLPIQPSLFAWKNDLRGLEYDVVKRVCRHRRGGKGLQDVYKAIHSLELIAEFEYGEVTDANNQG